MTTSISETDARRFRVLQLLEIDPRPKVPGSDVLDALRGMHFLAADAGARSRCPGPPAAFVEDLRWLEDRNLVRVDMLDPIEGAHRREVLVSLTRRGSEVIELTQPTSALHSIALGHGAHLTLCEPLGGGTPHTLAQAARALVGALVGGEPDIHAGTPAEAGARGKS